MRTRDGGGEVIINGNAPAEDLRTCFSKPWERCRCNQLEAYVSNGEQPAKTVAAAAGTDAGERRVEDVEH
jgi:hypothetical protein